MAVFEDKAGTEEQCQTLHDNCQRSSAIYWNDTADPVNQIWPSYPTTLGTSLDTEGVCQFVEASGLDKYRTMFTKRARIQSRTVTATMKMWSLR